MRQGLVRGVVLEANDLAIQVLGGYGYTREYPVEQYYRDNRLNPIHEGTNGIQAIDLLGRKAMMERRRRAAGCCWRELRDTSAQAAAVIGAAKRTPRPCATARRRSPKPPACSASAWPRAKLRLALANA